MRARAHARLILALSSLLSVAVFLSDVYLTPTFVLPGAAWGIPILVAALFLSPQLVAALVVFDLALEVWAGLIHGAAAGLWYLYVLGVAVMGILGVSLAARIEREVAQREVAQAERAFASAVLDTVGALVVVLDREGRIVRFNRACEELTGYAFDEVKDRRFWDFLLVPEEVEPVKVVFAELRDGHLPSHFENYWVTRDGGRRLLAWSNTVLLDKRGEVRHVIETGIDITERRRAREESLRLSRELDERAAELQAVLDSTPAAIWIAHDPESRRITGNAYADQIVMGVARGENISRSAPPGDAAVSYRVFRDGVEVSPESLPAQVATATGRPIEPEVLELRFPNGRRVEMLFGAVPLFDSAGQVRGAVVSGADVTPLRRAEAERERHLAELTFERDRLHTTIESIADVVLVCDREGTITISNGAARALFGEDLAQGECSLSDYADLLKLRYWYDGLLVPVEDLAITHALEGKETRDRAELATDPKTGQHLDLLVSAAPLRDADGQIVGAVEVAKDVSVLTALEHEKDEFIAVAAHELKTPVAIVKSFAQALQRRSPDLDPAQHRMLESIDKGCNRIDRIVRDLLDISRLQGGQLELSRDRLDLGALVSEVVERMALTTTKHRLRLTSAEPAIVWGDRDRLEQVLAVLVDNATRYSPRGGDVDVAMLVTSDEVVVEIRDQGVGIPAEKQPRLFERFYRAHTGTPYDYGGMGVGLYISKVIIAQHGGRLWFESQEGKGSTFCFSLPLLGGDRRRERGPESRR